jgi:hypothetical protein
MVLRPCFPELPGGRCWPQDSGAVLRTCFPSHPPQRAWAGRAPHNKRLHAAGAYVLKEVAFARGPGAALRALTGTARESVDPRVKRGRYAVTEKPA